METEIAKLKEELRSRGWEPPIPAPTKPLVPIADLLPEIFSNLPRATGLLTLEDLSRVMSDFEMYCSSQGDADPREPADLEMIFNEVLKPRAYSFVVPLARVATTTPTVQVGGRSKLGLLSAEWEEVPFFALLGEVTVGHECVARRFAVETAAEVLGLLMAVGVAQYRTRRRRPGDDVPHLSIIMHCPDPDEPFEAEPQSLSWRETHDVCSTVLLPPDDATELERAEQKRLGKGEGILQSRIELATRPFRIGGMAAKKIRRAARYLRKAVTSDEPGDAYLYLATCLEGLLLDGEKKDDLSARVADAVGFLLGRTHDERVAFRERATHLYKVRSSYVHKGEYTGSELERLKCIELARAVVAAELRLLRDLKT